ncbi:hypothetical protein [Anaerorhabdus sp.]|uniref:hypothetical protein n=1 Tax=Anaerorhabdus sp. TaxID=1872524 RepID=UPI002FC6D854
MFIVIFATVIGCVMLGVKFKEFRESKEALTGALDVRKFEHYSFYKFILAMYIVFVLIGILSAIYGLSINDTNTAAMGIVIALLFAGEALTAPYKYSLYYNESCFVAKGKTVRYKSIKQFDKIKYIPFAFVKVVTTNGEKYPISPKAFDIIYKKYEECKKK